MYGAIALRGLRNRATSIDEGLRMLERESVKTVLLSLQAV